MTDPGKGKPTIGWREWVTLPELGVRAIKVKIDTGARTSALHVFDLRHVRFKGKKMVRFRIHPLQRSKKKTVSVRVPIVDRRTVRSSFGTEQKRTVIRTLLEISDRRWPIEVTLACRDAMGFRMILGREAIRGRFSVDPGRSFLTGKPPSRTGRKMKKEKTRS